MPDKMAFIGYSFIHSVEKLKAVHASSREVPLKGFNSFEPQSAQVPLDYHWSQMSGVFLTMKQINGIFFCDELQFSSGLAMAKEAGSVIWKAGLHSRELHRDLGSAGPSL